ncbi:MAG TPA: SLC13 family permease [Gammaproteobacteria bacterium]|jgi:Na+/H+ antiporter NhaD/arsenite permease-like protein
MDEPTLTGAMLASGVVLALTFIAIFTEQIHHVERAKCAAAGAVAMILTGYMTGFYSPTLALEAVDWNVIFLLAAMMMVIAVMIPTGGFNWMAYRLAELAGGKVFLTLVLTGTAVTVLSMLLDNVTTVVIFGPLLILIARAQGISPIPYLLAAALLTDTGGIATLVGDPPNIMIGSAAGIDFNTFFLRMGPIVLVAWLVILLSLKYLFRAELAHEGARVSRGEAVIKDKRTWMVSLLVLAMMVVLFSLHDALGWEVWFVAVLGMTILLLLSPRETIEHVMTRVETGLLMFFIGLFMVIGGVEHSGLLEHIGGFIMPFVEADLLLATIVLMWVAAFLSAAIDNIPFTAAMIPIILGMESAGLEVTPLWWGLSMGVGLGGNGTHIGSTANVFIVTISERLAREQNDPGLAITPALWFRKGTPAMLVSLAAATVVFVLFFDYFARPIH